MVRRVRIIAFLMVFLLLTGGLQTGSFARSRHKKKKNNNQTVETDVSSSPEEKNAGTGDYETLELDEDGSYDTKDEVCAYLVQFRRLPSNYMTKKEARKEGWEGGALNRIIPGKCIGGDSFGNYEMALPEKDGREYHECDIDTLGQSKRGGRRIIYSGDDDNEEWNIYYTDDHYDTFTLLWGEDDYE